jgi:hypothetical protein
MRIALGCLAVVAACAEPVEGPPVGELIEPAFVGEYGVTEQSGCYLPHPMGPADTLFIGDRGEIVWRNLFGDTLHYGQMVEDQLVVPAGEDYGVERVPYEFQFIQGEIWADPEWITTEGNRFCVVELTRRTHEN